ncbi:MAG: glucoamylase family protein, partial [Candidatus Desantisbacteria bacterium]
LCLMGIASPTHPVGINTFYSWKREQGAYSTYSLIQSAPGSLFTYFFAHCWLKLKGLGSDSHPTISVNWWENSVNAAGANWKYCQDKNYEGWGLTACEGQDGSYYAYGALPCGDTSGPKDDATIAPYGAGSSIAFLPVESISTLKHYFQNTDLWRYLFGFGDAYNPHNSTVTTHYNGAWYNHTYFGIDQGPMLIMIENYRSGLIWKYFMQNGDIQKALLTIFPDAVYSIKGKAKDSEGKGVSRLRVELSGDKSAVYWTEEDGYYEFSKIPFGSNIIVAPIPVYGMQFKPLSKSYTGLTQDYAEQNFEIVSPPVIPVNNLFNPAKGERTTIVYKLEQRCHVIIKL